MKAQNHHTCSHTLRQNQGQTLDPALSARAPPIFFSSDEAPRSTKGITWPGLHNGSAPFPAWMARSPRQQRPSLGSEHLAGAHRFSMNFRLQIVKVVIGRDRYSPNRSGEKAGERGEHEQVRRNKQVERMECEVLSEEGFPFAAWKDRTLRLQRPSLNFW